MHYITEMHVSVCVCAYVCINTWKTLFSCKTKTNSLWNICPKRSLA